MGLANVFRRPPLDEVRPVVIARADADSAGDPELVRSDAPVVVAIPRAGREPRVLLWRSDRQSMKFVYCRSMRSTGIGNREEPDHDRGRQPQERHAGHDATCRPREACSRRVRSMRRSDRPRRPGGCGADQHDQWRLRDEVVARDTARGRRSRRHREAARRHATPAPTAASAQARRRAQAPPPEAPPRQDERRNYGAGLGQERETAQHRRACDSKPRQPRSLRVRPGQPTARRRAAGSPPGR